MDNYGWIITYDVIDGGRANGVTGPHDIADDVLKRLKAGEGEHFKMFDDDGNLYYVGLLIGGTGFEPLDDYGTPNAGCTTIRINGEEL